MDTSGCRGSEAEFRLGLEDGRLAFRASPGRGSQDWHCITTCVFIVLYEEIKCMYVCMYVFMHACMHACMHVLLVTLSVVKYSTE